MADEQDSGSCVGHHVWVQVPSSALNFIIKPLEIRMFQGVLYLATMKGGQLRGKIACEVRSS